MTSSTTPSAPAPSLAHAFPPAGSPMAAALHAHDWGGSSLGPLSAWPAPLRSAACLVLDSPLPTWLAWGTGLGTLYNEPYARLLGARHPGVLGAPLREVCAADWPHIGQAVAGALAGQALHHADRPLTVQRDGVAERAWFNVSYAPLRDDAGAVNGVLCIAWQTAGPTQPGGDPAAKEAETALRESERRFRALFESMDEGFCIIELLDGPHGPLSDYVHVAANPAFAANAGIPDAVGQRVRDIVPDEADGWVDIYRRVLLTGEPVRFQRELVATGRQLELASFRLDPPERRQVAVLFRDVTERHRAQTALRELNETLERRVAEEVAERTRTAEALRQSQKMEAVGQLTGGIAHDFNNMLAIIMNSLELLDRKFLLPDPRAKRLVEAAKNGGKRAALLTQRLLAFSRQQPLKPEVVDANKLVAGMSDLLRHSLGGAVRLETVLAGGLWRTHADPHQLENAILNLVVNGRDAMPDGGRLTVETANCHLDARYAAEHDGISAGQYVLIAVTDTGIGMASDVVAKAFDPFFTTKEVGRGSGLGLSQVYGFVRQSGGHVKIYSEPGHGTSVKIYLPRLPGEHAAAAETAAGEAAAPGDSQEVILVVEDEPDVRHLSVESLRELGYRVLEADGAAAALSLLDAHPEVQLLFTDVMMPDVNGRKLADEARRRYPSLKVLFTTGYSRNALVHNGALDAGVQLITKPFTLDELALRVRELLDGAA